jgi:hypothetical protein
MTRLTITLSDPEQALLLEEVAWHLSSVTAVTHERDEAEVDQVAEPAEQYGTLTPLTAEDWIRPGRPATDEELAELLAESERQLEAGEFFTAEEVKARMDERIAKWKRSNGR